jgi:YegS/Rv2252/BmrU family lipid kinase
VVPSAEGAATSSSIAVIINPISGTGGRIEVARARAAHAAARLASHGSDPSNVFITERSGHAREIAANAVHRGISTIVAWGGDGTMNEVGTALAFTGVALALIPSGSGNGLSRELGIPFEPSAALDVACSGVERTIDAGEVGERLFFNVAGVGLDARVAHCFAVDGLEKRGFARYMRLTMRELAAYEPDLLTVTTSTSSVSKPSLLVAIANGRQYGNGAVIAPRAKLDDGRLDIVTIEARSLVRALLELPFVFLGMVDRVGGVRMEKAESVEITSPHPIVYHLDGEPIAGTLGISARVRPGALKVRVPAA